MIFRFILAGFLVLSAALRACSFVASFIGTPPMNIIELAKSKLPQKLMIGAGEKSTDAAYFGFRPSACRMEKAEGVKGKVLFTEAIGENKYAYIKLAEGGRGKCKDRGRDPHEAR